MEAKTFSDLIDSYLNHCETADAKVLEAAKTIDDIIGILSNPNNGNGLVKGARKKGLAFIGEITDPRTCWHYADVLYGRAEPALVDLKDALDPQASKLIKGIRCEFTAQIDRIPEWFFELLRWPESISPGCREVLYLKAATMKEDLSRFHNPDVCQGGRTYE